MKQRTLLSDASVVMPELKTPANGLPTNVAFGSVAVAPDKVTSAENTAPKESVQSRPAPGHPAAVTMMPYGYQMYSQPGFPMMPYYAAPPVVNTVRPSVIPKSQEVGIDFLIRE